MLDIAARGDEQLILREDAALTRCLEALAFRLVPVAAIFDRAVDGQGEPTSVSRKGDLLDRLALIQHKILVVQDGAVELREGDTRGRAAQNRQRQLRMQRRAVNSLSRRAGAEIVLFFVHRDADMGIAPLGDVHAEGIEEAFDIRMIAGGVERALRR